MKVMFHGTETTLRKAIKQTWAATKIYWRLRMNSHLMIKAHVSYSDNLQQALSSDIRHV